MKLQIALDCPRIMDALAILEQTADYVDIIEVGTPLLLGEGLAAVRKIRAKYLDRVILADTKIIDAGAFEARLCFESGADIVTVLGSAEDETIRQAVMAARTLGRCVFADLIAVQHVPERCMKLAALGVDCVCLHTAYDLSRECPPPLASFVAVKQRLKTVRIAVTGGVSLDNVRPLIAFKPDVIVVGRSITDSLNMTRSARAFHTLMN